MTRWKPPGHRLFTAEEWRLLARLFGFTGKELRLAKAILDEKRNAEIAADLSITPRRVTAARKEIFAKVGVDGAIGLLLTLYKRLREEKGEHPGPKTRKRRSGRRR